MKPVPFEYCCPDSLEEAVMLLSEHGDDAVVMAGGLSLGAMLNMRMVRPAVVIDINRIESLGTLETQESTVRIGAMARQADVLMHPVCRESITLLEAGLQNVGHYQTRSRGTLGGSVAHADPSAEAPLCLATLGGEIELMSARGMRRVAAAEFFEGALVTAREPDEMITALILPVVGGATAFEEINERRGDFAIVAAAAWAARNGGTIRYGFGLGGVEDRPRATQGSIETSTESPEALAERIAAGLVTELEPMDDHRASGEYRLHLARHLGVQVILRALAGGGV